MNQNNQANAGMTAQGHLQAKTWWHRIGVALLAVVAILLGVGSASAQQTSVSVVGNGGIWQWSSNAMWLSGGVPISANNLTIVLQSSGFTTWFPDVATNIGGLTLNTLIATNTTAGSSGPYIQPQSGPATLLVFDGVNPSIIVSNGPTGALAFSQTGGGSMGIQLNQNLNFYNNGSGQSGGFLAISGVGAFNLNTPKADFRLRSTSSFTGGFNVNAGALTIDAAAGLGAPANVLTMADGTWLQTGTANQLVSRTNPVVLNGDISLRLVNNLSLSNSAISLGTTAGTARTITVTNSAVTFTLGPIANGATANGITKAGAGVLTLSGTNTYTGATTVSAGTLNIRTISAGAGSFSVADGATLAVNLDAAGNTLLMNGLTLGASAGGDNLTFNLGAITPISALITNNGALTLNGPVTINVSSPGLPLGTYVLMTYASGGTGTFNSGSLPVIPNISYSIVNDTVNKQVKLVVSSTPAVKWAVGNGNWDTSSLNWTNLSGGGTLTNYVENAYAIFDDTASGTSPIAVTLTAPHSPGAVTNNSTKNYTISGSAMTGIGYLVKAGASTLTLLNANTFTGGTTISVGALQLGDGAANNGSVAGNIADNAALLVANPSAVTLPGIISGTGSLTKTGAGTLTLTAASTYSGGTLISAGVIQLGDGASLNGSLAGNITNNAALVVANPTAQTIAGVISGTGSLTKSGAGNLTLTGANTYTGATINNAGTLTVSTVGNGNGSYVVANGATLAINNGAAGKGLTMSSLTLGTSAATTLNFNLGAGNPTASQVTNTGALTLGGTVTVNVTGTGLSTGTIILMSYGSGGAGTFVAGALPAVAGGYASLVNDTGTKQLKLVVATNPTMVWNSPNSVDNWDTTSLNWTNANTAGALINYQDGYPVRFDDTAPGGSPEIITLDVAHNPGNVTINDPTVIYQFNGAAITGVGALTKSGDALAYMNISNSYTGGTLINGGTYVLGGGNNAQALGNPATTTLVTVTNTGSLKLNLNGLTNASQFVVVSGFGAGDGTRGAVWAGVGGNFPLFQPIVTCVRNLRLAGDAAIGGTAGAPDVFSSLWDIGVFNVNGNLSVAGNYLGKIDAQGFNLSKVGTDYLLIYATNITAAASFTVGGGAAEFVQSGGTPFGPYCPISITNGAFIETYDASGLSSYPNSGLTFSNNFTIGSGGGDGGEIHNAATRYVGPGNDNYYGTITLNGPLTVLVQSWNSNNKGLTPGTSFNGPIAGTNSAYGIFCNGPALQTSNVVSRITFNATNNYNGPTVLSGFVKVQTSTIQKGGGDYTVGDNSTLDVLQVAGTPTLPMKSLNLGGSVIATLDLSRLSSLPATPVIYATNLVVNSTTKILLPVGWANNIGSFPLIKYEGTVGGLGAAGLTGVPRGVSASFVDDTANHLIKLVVSATPGVVWVGNLSNGWDTGVTANWNFSGATTYADNDYVTFDDTASTFGVIQISNSVAPYAVNVNAATNYTFAGSSITGSAYLAKSGSGILTVSMPNTFSAGTFLNAGELDLGDNNAVGTGTLTISNGTRLASVVAARTMPNNLSILGDFAVGGRGFGTTFTGGVNLNGGLRTITMTSYHQVNGVISNGGIGLAAVGGYTLALFGTNTYTGGTLLGNNGGILAMDNTGAMGPSGTIEFNGNSTLQWNIAGIPDLSSRIKMDDGFTATFDTVANSVTLNNALTLGSLGTAALAKIGSGTLTLTAANTYSGATTVSAGTLMLNGSGALPNTTLIRVAGGATFNVGPSGMTLSGSQTLANNASATGTIVGNLTTSTGTVSVSYTNGTPSLTVNSGTLMLAAGTVFNLNNTGPALAINTTNLVISTGAGGVVAGTAPSSVTVTGGGASGAASLQIIGGQLYLVVASTTPPNTPTILPPYVSSSQIVLRVVTQLGYNYALQSATNLNPPVVWSPVVTNSGTGGTITNLIPIGSVPPQQFFRYGAQ